MAAKFLKSLAALAALLLTVVVFVDPAFAAGGTLQDPGVVYAGTDQNIVFNGQPDPYTGEPRTLEVEGGAKPDLCEHGDDPDDGEIGTAPDGEPSGACFTVQFDLNNVANGTMTLTGASGGGLPGGAEILGATSLPSGFFNIFGTRDEINAALATLTFNPESDYETSYPDAGDPTFIALDIKDGNGDDVEFVDGDGDVIGDGEIELDLRIEQANDGPDLEIDALNQPVAVAAGDEVVLTNNDGVPDFADDVFVTDPDLDDDEIDDVMLLVAWLDGGGGQADFSLSPSVSPDCVSSLEEIMLQDDATDIGEPLEDRCDVLPGPIDLSLVPAGIPSSLSFTSSTQDQQAIAMLGRYNGLDNINDSVEDILSYIEFDAMPTGDCDCTITVVISDLGNNGLPLENVVPGIVLPDPGFDIETIDFEVRDAVNDPPVVTPDPAGPTPVDELASVPVSFTVEDPDAAGDLTVTGISVVGGTLTGAPAVPLDGSPSALTAALSGLSFTANETSADPGLGSVTVSVEDNGWGAAEDPADSKSASGTATFRIDEDGLPDSDPNPETNDPPVLTAPPSLYAIEGVVTPFTPATIGVTDPDAASDDLTMTITPTGGTTNSDGVSTGTLTELNALLDGLTYTATQDADFDDAVGTVLIEVSDDGHNPDTDVPADVGTDSVTVDVTIEDDEEPPLEVNDPPVLTAPGSISTNEGSAFAFDPATIGVIDPDAGADDLTLTITSTGEGTTNEEGAHTGSLTELNTLLDGLTFTPDQDADTVDDLASIQIDVNDEGHNPDSNVPAEEGTDSVTIDVAIDDDDVEPPDVNDPPVLTAPANATVTEGVAAGFDAATIGLTDPDAGTDDLTLTITPTGGTTSDDGVTTGTLTELNTLLDGLTFTGSQDADFNDEVGSILIEVTDNGHNPDTDDPADEGTDSVTIDLVIEDDDEAPPEVNDPPELTAPASIGAAEGSPFAFAPASLGLTDPDAGTDDLTLTITTTGDGATNEDGVHTGTLTELNTLLDGLTFTPDDDADTADGAASILIEVTDNGHNPDTDDPADEGTDAAIVAVAIDDDDVEPANDPPTLAVPGAQTVQVSGTIAFTGGLRITVDDPDAGGGDLVLHLTSTGGGLSPATADVTGTLAELQAFLDSLVFTAGADPGSATITVSVDDQGNTGTGGPLTATATIAVTITAAPLDNTTTTTTATTATTAMATTATAVTTTADPADPAAVAAGSAAATAGSSSGTLPRTGPAVLLPSTIALLLGVSGAALTLWARRRSGASVNRGQRSTRRPL